jgi:hypothetical protein
MVVLGGAGRASSRPGGSVAVGRGHRVGVTEHQTTAPERAHYAGAVYGSILAASVVVGASTRDQGPRPIELIVLLVVTGIVFWLSHSYAHLFGDRMAGRRLDWTEVRTVAQREWPIAQASLPPAVAAAVAAVAGASNQVVGWSALLTALAAQLTWALIAAHRAGTTGPIMALSAVINIVLGLVIVLLKALLSH